MTFDNTTLIAISEIRGLIKDVKETEKMLKVAMEAARNHWLVIDENKRFTSAVGAVMAELGEDHEDYETLLKEMKVLQVVGAMLSGVPVNLEAAIPPENSFGLLKMWKDLK